MSAGTKEEIRNAVNACRKRVNSEDRVKASGLACRQLDGIEAFETARTVSVYLSLPWEIDTGEIITRRWDRQALVCIPAFDMDCEEYGLAEYQDGIEMSAGNFGTREPSSPKWVPCSKVDVFVVPGVAFGRNGERIGHGGGHYDRILSRARPDGALKVGLGYDFQVFDFLPQEKNDVRLDMVVTESRVIRCS